MNLSKVTRESIVARAVTAAFKDRHEALAAEENALALRCYQEIFPASVIKAAKAFPGKGWLQLDSCLRFNANGWTALLNTTEAVAVPHRSGSCSPLGSITGLLADEVQAHLQKKARLKEEQRSASAALRGTLNGIRTAKRLQEAWPEGRPFYEASLAPSSQAVAIPFDAINLVLGLAAAVAA